jgi:hypothetical protein
MKICEKKWKAVNFDLLMLDFGPRPKIKNRAPRFCSKLSVFSYAPLKNNKFSLLRGYQI